MSSASASPSPVSSAALNQDIRGPATSSNLYLVTFLATLFLLLFVSCAIVLRSYILRRRYQRRLDEAMATGLLLAPRTPGSKRKRFGTKPKLYDAWLTGGGVTWDHIKPLAAQPVFVKRKYKEAPLKNSAVISEDQAEQNLEDIITNGIRPPSGGTPHSSPAFLSQRTALLSHFRNLLWRSRRNSPIAISGLSNAEPETRTTEVEASNNINSPVQVAPTSTAGYKVRVEMLQVAVLISLPSQSRVIRKSDVSGHADKYAIEEKDDEGDDDDEENRLPELVLGTTRVHCRQPKSVKDIYLSGNATTRSMSPAVSRRDIHTMTILPGGVEPLSPNFS